MKTTFKIIVMMAVATSFAACAVKKNEKSPLKKDANIEGKAKTADVCVGGQPGAIELQGGTVKGTDGKPVLDSRIKIEPLGGMGLDKTVAVSKTKGVVKAVSETLDMKDVSEDRSFVNLGCGFLGAATQGLTEKKLSDAKDVAMTKANRIFICGTLNLPAGMVSMKADAIYMQDAEITMAGNYPNTVLIQANAIGVKGHNSINIYGLSGKEASDVLPASLTLVVAKEMQGGDGDLSLTSHGRSCIADASTPADTDVKSGPDELGSPDLNEKGEDLTK